jgi:hypothetical protein
MRIAATLTLAACFATAALAQAPQAPEAAPTLEITWPPEGAEITLGQDPLRAIGVVVRSNFRLMPAGQCGGDARCGHLHMKIDPEGDTCNRPGKPLFGRANSMNSDFGGPLIQANFGACPSPTGEHVIGVLLADDRHQPVLVDGKPVTALVKVRTR